LRSGHLDHKIDFIGIKTASHQKKTKILTTNF